MKTKFLALVFLASSHFSFSQEQTLSLGFNYKLYSADITHNESKQENFLVLEKSKGINTYLLDETLQVKDSIHIEALPKTHKYIQGFSIGKENYNVFFLDSKQKRVTTLSLNFKEKSTAFSETEFLLEKEIIVQKHFMNNKFYIISIEKYKPFLNFHIFDSDLKHTVKKIEIRSVNYVAKNGFRANIYSIVKDDGFYIPKFEEDTPSSLESTIRKSKLFIRNNAFTFSFDHKKEHSYIVKISTDDWSVSEQRFSKKILKGFKTSHNSFLYDNYLYQIGASSKKMSLCITDLKTNSKLKEIEIDKKEEIHIKNTPIYYKTSSFFDQNNIKTTEKTSKFLYSLSRMRIGINISKVDSLTHMTIGATAIAINNMQMMNMMMQQNLMQQNLMQQNISNFRPSFGPNANEISTIDASELVPLKSESIANKTKIWIECLLDTQGNHIDGKIQEDQFKKIEKFSETIKNIQFENIFTIDKKNYFGYFKATQNPSNNRPSQRAQNSNKKYKYSIYKF